MSQTAASDGKRKIQRKILLVDDEKGIRDSLQLLLQQHFQVETAATGIEAVALVERFRPDLMLLDVQMPELDGIGTLRQLASMSLTVPTIMLTADGTVQNAVEAMKLGAVDYIMKPFDIKVLTSLIVSTLRSAKSGPDKIEGEEGRQVERVVAESQVSYEIVSNTRSFIEVLEDVEKVAVRDTTVLITGESGTGKELIARKIHDKSDRANGPFIAINCGAIPDSLIESELFGHEKGAFTSAVESKPGFCELAHRGTLFLDEIGELSMAVQVKLLRFLQEREFYRIGRSKPVKVDVRVIAATNKNLEELMIRNEFRQDLFYRINVVNIKLPPLRDRFEDIPVLVSHFQKKFASVYGNRSLNFSEDAMNQLVQYSWPGNVRELENVVESVMALCPENSVRLEDLPAKVRNIMPMTEDELEVFKGSLNFHDAEKVFETEIIVKALRKTNFVQTRAAELLGITRRILKYKMDKLGINDDGTTRPISN